MRAGGMSQAGNVPPPGTRHGPQRPGDSRTGVCALTAALLTGRVGTSLLAETQAEVEPGVGRVVVGG